MRDPRLTANFQVPNGTSGNVHSNNGPAFETTGPNTFRAYSPAGLTGPIGLTGDGHSHDTNNVPIIRSSESTRLHGYTGQTGYYGYTGTTGTAADMASSIRRE
jgi:hypothetical protein